MSVRSHFRLILAKADTEPLAFVVALSTFLWGCWLLNPLSDAFQISSSYRVMRELGFSLVALGSPIEPETFWGLLIGGLGGAHLYGVLTGHLWLRRWGAFSTFLLRAGLVMATGLATNFANAGIPDYACWAAASLWIYWRLSLAARSAEGER